MASKIIAECKRFSELVYKISEKDLERLRISVKESNVSSINIIETFTLQDSTEKIDPRKYERCYKMLESLNEKLETIYKSV